MQLPRVIWPSRVLGVVVTLGVVWGCADTGTTTTTPPAPVATSIALSSPTVALDGLGATQQLTATVKDQNGAAMSSATVTWASDAAGVASVGTAGLVTAVTKGTANVTATSASLSATAAVTVTQTPKAFSKVSGDNQTGTVGAALGAPLVVKVLDAQSSPISGVSVAFAVTGGAGSVGTAAATTGADGTASSTWTLGTSAAAAQVATATVTGLTAAGFTATGTADVPSTITVVSGNNQTGLVSAALTNPVVVKVSDQYGNPIGARTVTFAVTGGGGSVSPTSTPTTANGQAQTTWTLGPGSGAQSMTASSLGTGGAALTGSPLAIGATGTALSLTSITEDTLTEGISIHLTGTGFSATPASNTVLIDGLAATVTVASATQLTVTVPAFDCKPARDGNTTVGVGGATSNAVSKRIHPASFITATTVGTQQIIQTPANFCLQFRPSTTGGDGYLVGVGAAAETPGTLFPITISTGTGAASAPIFAAQAPLPLFASAAASARPVQTPLDAEVSRLWSGQYQAEARIRAAEGLLWARRRQGSAVPAAPRAAQVAMAVPNVGDVIPIRVPDFSSGNGCTTYNTISAKVKVVGATGIWVRDPANPGPDSLSDVEIQGLSDTLDQKIFPADTGNFGAPSDIDNNGGRIIIVLTIKVNAEPIGAAGFVFSGDLFAPASCAQSNQGEVFYGQVPDPGNVAGTGARTHAAVSFQMPSLIAHEFSHDIQFSRRLVLSGPSGVGMSLWEAEGQAMMAQELNGFKLFGDTPGSNYGYATAVGDAQRARWYKQGFDLLGAYFGFKYQTLGKNANSPEQCSLYATTSTANVACFNFAFYGAAYSFERYLIDRFGPTYPGGGSTKMIHDVIGKSPSLAGRPNWEALLGVTPAGYDSLYAQWASTLYVDDRAGVTQVVAQTMPSWNLFNILTTFGSDYQLAPMVRTFTAFSDARSVMAGGTAYTTISAAGARPALAVKVRDGSGAVISTTPRMQVWVTRIQ